MEDIEIVNKPTKKSVEENDVDKKQKDISPGVTRMKATSTTSSPDLATDNSGSRRKKKRVYLSREQKEMEEKRLALSFEKLENEKTIKRISHELPKCNWLEEKLKEIEKNEVRRSSLDRMIEEELSQRKSITSCSEKQEPKAGVASPSPAAGSDGSPAPVQSNIHQTESTPSRAPVMDKELAELQEKLVQQKENLLKDIRVIQKRKIKELDELYQIKLKKKDFEKELEKTREDIKKMEVDFQAARNQRTEQQQQTSELKTRCSLEAVNRQNERLPSPLTIAPSSHTQKTSQDQIWVRPNLLADRTQPPPRHQETGRARSVWHIESQLQLPRPEDSVPTPPHLMPQLQQRRVSGDSSHSFSPDLRPDPAEHLQRLTEDARKSFQPYKPHHDLRRPVEQQAGPGYLPHPAHTRPGVKEPERERLAMTQLTDSALASHLLEYYRSLGLLPPGPRLPPGQVSPVLIRPTPVTPVTPVTRGEPLPGYHDPRHLHQAAARLSSARKTTKRSLEISALSPLSTVCTQCHLSGFCRGVYKARIS